MNVMFSGRSILVRLSRRSRLVQSRPLCGNNKPITLENNDGSNSKDVDNRSSLSRHDAYKQLEKLDFMTAAKILFTDPPKKKKFGFDFHLVQFFFACLPSLAVYLVAQYARYEMRRMEAEQELKRQAEEEANAKELELMAEEDKQEAIDPQLSEVKARLDKLEETLKEIAVETKMKSGNVTERSASEGMKKEPGKTEPGTSSEQEKTTPSSEANARPRASLPDQKQVKSEGSSHGANK